MYDMLSSSAAKVSLFDFIMISGFVLILLVVIIYSIIVIATRTRRVEDNLNDQINTSLVNNKIIMDGIDNILANLGEAPLARSVEPSVNGDYQKHLKKPFAGFAKLKLFRKLPSANANHSSPDDVDEDMQDNLNQNNSVNAHTKSEISSYQKSSRQSAREALVANREQEQGFDHDEIDANNYAETDANNYDNNYAETDANTDSNDSVVDNHNHATIGAGNSSQMANNAYARPTSTARPQYSRPQGSSSSSSARAPINNAAPRPAITTPARATVARDTSRVATNVTPSINKFKPSGSPVIAPRAANFVRSTTSNANINRGTHNVLIPKVIVKPAVANVAARAIGVNRLQNIKLGVELTAHPAVRASFIKR